MSIVKRIITKAQYLLPHYFLSKLVYRVANISNTYIKNKLIGLFIKKFNVDLSIAERKNITDYKNFNDFFTRKLDLISSNRAINLQAQIISPADGVIAAIGKVENNLLYQAKGKIYSLFSLMGEKQSTKSALTPLCDKFLNGSYFTIYLAPKDYHRVHMSCQGQLEQMIYIPGRLFSVNQTTCNNINNIFARNERLINIFKTDHGYMAVILVGALLVGSMATSWHGIVTPPHGVNQHKKVTTWDYANNTVILNKADELGYFQMGSTVIVLFSENYDFDPQLLNTNTYYGKALK